MAKFVLNLGLCRLGLHIQVHAEEKNREERDQASSGDQNNPRQSSHAQTLRRPSLKKRSKQISRFSRTSDTLVILNPAACSDRAQRLRSRIEELIGDCAFCTTSRCGDAEVLARRAVQEGFQKVVAAGGDGTIHEVVNGLAGSDAMLGLLPMGTVNVFAMELGLPSSNLEDCWEIIRAGKTRRVDLPSANGKYFVQLGGIGLDAQVVKETSLAFKRSFGPLSYLISAAQIAGRTPPRLSIESENAFTNLGASAVHSEVSGSRTRCECAQESARYNLEGSFVLIGNGRLYGGPFPFFKHAVIDDGLFDVVVFKQLGYLEIIKYLQDVVFSSDIRVPEIEYFQTRHLQVASDQNVPVELDGELIGNCPVKFQIQKKALRVLVPAGERKIS